jgi:hypothetical protein
MNSFFRNSLSVIFAGTMFFGASRAFGDVAQAIPEMGDLERWAVFSLGDLNFGNSLTSDTRIQGDVGVANGNINLGGNARIEGDLYYRSNAILYTSGNAVITGAQFQNQDALLDSESSQAMGASDAAFALQPNRSNTTISLKKSGSLSISGAPGETVVLNLKNFQLKGNATLTLQGTATTNFIINVKNQFALSSNAMILLSGGAQWNNVLYNVHGPGADVTLAGGSSLQGILMATQRTVRLTGSSLVTGEVIGNRNVISDGSQVIHPPIVSQ